MIKVESFLKFLTSQEMFIQQQSKLIFIRINNLEESVREKEQFWETITVFFTIFPIYSFSVIWWLPLVKSYPN